MSSPIRRLFFALLPDPEVAREIERTATTIKADGRVRGRWVQPSKYHLTVHFLGNHFAHPESLIERAGTAAQRVQVAPFEIELVRVETFGGRRQSPCVVRSSPRSDPALELLRAQLGHALAETGPAEWLEQSFTPHVTIAYANARLGEPIEIPAIAWRVRDFALVESQGAAAHHEVLEQWTLRAPGTL